jgi:integrase
MPRGCAVIRTNGVRGAVWFVKWVDANGTQVKERLGREADGWDEKKARDVLNEKLVDVRRDGLVRPTVITVDTHGRDWLERHPARKNLKRSTREGYRTILETHLIPEIGHLRLDQVTPNAIDRYIATKQKQKLSPRTINSHLNQLHLILADAQRRGLIKSNPVTLIDRPAPARRQQRRLLAPEEIALVERAFVELAADEESGYERAIIETGRSLFLTVYALGLRRAEVLGLRWRNVHLADPDGATVRICETWTRNQVDTPKSRAGERTLSLGQRAAEVLFQHRRMTAYGADDDMVFPHPATGNPLHPARYAKVFRAALAKAGIEGDVGPFHDGRRSSLTNAAAAGLSGAVLQARAGHSSYSTTQLYVDLAGVRFREEAERVEDRVLGGISTHSSTPLAEHDGARRP